MHSMYSNESDISSDQWGPTPEEYKALWDVDPGRLMELMKRGQDHGKGRSYVPPGQRGPTPAEREDLWDTDPGKLMQLDTRGQKGGHWDLSPY